MPTLTIPISEALMEKIESRASASGHPVEDEVILCLYYAAVERPMPRKRTPEEEAELERKIRRYQANMPKVNTTNDELNRYKREGRL